ncbi:MAG: hypothetical protein IKV61_00955 [Clostridia bacterium]|nr:hypothetical protein [Clostridia bacterium]
MKNKSKTNFVSAFTISNFFVGLFVGAGFMSGQELWQYFGRYKFIGVIFLIFGSFLQGFLGYFIAKKAREKGVYHFDVLPCKNNVFLRRTFIVTELIFMIFTASIMIAGANSLYESIFLKSGVWFSLLFTITVSITAYFGIDGVVTIFKMVMPILLTISAVIFIETIKTPLLNFEVTFTKISLKDGFSALYACVIYIFHNVYLSLALLVPFSKKIQNYKVGLKGFFLSSITFLIFSLFVLTPIMANQYYSNYPLPLLELSKTVSPFIFYIFALFLCVAMFLSCLSSSVAVIDALYNKNKAFLKNKPLIITLCALCSFLLSRVGFKVLIAVMYPICGYLGIIFIIRLVFCSYSAKIK